LTADGVLDADLDVVEIDEHGDPGTACVCGDVHCSFARLTALG
jgi:hypothetical protein